MTSPGSAHPLDIDLADLVDGLLDDVRAVTVEAHLATCLLCRIKLLRLAQAPPPGSGPGPAGGASRRSPAFAVPFVDEGREPARGEIWLGGEDDGMLVVLLRARGEHVLVAPVSLDVEAADDRAVIVDAGHSPLGTGIVVHLALAAEVPAAALVGRVAAFDPGSDLDADAPGARRGAPIDGDSDPRLELRRYLAERMAALDPPSPTGSDQVTAVLVDDLRGLRGPACSVRALDGWAGVVDADRSGWVPLAVVDEVGVVLIVLDTPHGLADDRDFDLARAVLTRGNASALVVLAGELSELADVYDAPALNHGVDMPSGAHTPPRPLISGLVPFDAVTKYLDQHSGARAMSPPTRGPATRVDVAELLRDAAATAVVDAVRQGGRFKILAKRRGYESLAGAPDALGAALATAFTGASVVDAVLGLARGDGDEREGAT